VTGQHDCCTHFEDATEIGAEGGWGKRIPVERGSSAGFGRVLFMRLSCSHAALSIGGWSSVSYTPAAWRPVSRSLPCGASGIKSRWVFLYISRETRLPCGENLLNFFGVAVVGAAVAGAAVVGGSHGRGRALV